MAILKSWHASRLTITVVVVVTSVVTVSHLFTVTPTVPYQGHFISQKSDLQRIEDISSEPAITGSALVDRKKKKADSLPDAVIDGINKFVFFLGHPRSGHSIIASLLDAHPHIIIAHEVNIFTKMSESRPRFTTKSTIFNALWKNSFYSFWQGHRSKQDAIKGYTLTIEGLYQGAYQSYIEVIGDKKAGKSTGLLANDPTEWHKVYRELKSIVSLPIKVFHCIRNPYDNIATLIIDNAVVKNHGSLNSTTIGKVRNSHENYTFNPQEVEQQINMYFKYYQAIEDIKLELDMLQIHHQDLIENPRETINKMCDFLGVSCSENYLDICSDKIFKSPSKSRYRIVWEQYQLSEIKSQIKKIGSLQRYIEFNS